MRVGILPNVREIPKATKKAAFFSACRYPVREVRAPDIVKALIPAISACRYPVRELRARDIVEALIPAISACFLRNSQIFAAISLFLVVTSSAVASDSCRTEKYDDEFAVTHVIDGDTVRLKGGRLLRFVGINSPEIDHKGANSQAYALQARQVLKQQIGPQKRIKLVYGSDKQDRHGRLLAHVFSLDGSNIQAALLSIGVAHWIVVPPNLNFRDCYRTAEKSAQQQKINLWSAAGAKPLVIAANSQLQKGFTLLEGRVQRISRDKKGLSLHLLNRLVLRVASRHLNYFSENHFNAYQKSVIQARGWLYPRKGGWQMSLKHPDSVWVMHR